MRLAKALFLTAMMAGAALGARDASACGGCFASPSEVTQITGERMLLSLSQQQTTLYDEITYSGNPSSFAWVLPIKGLATVGLSSDALFQNLGQDTSTTISAPQITCPSSNCGNAAFNNSDDPSAGGGGASTGGTVTVVSQQVVGPYETVQLQSTDPMALRNWLATNGYNVPATDGPVIDAYVAEGFNFLALKLVPGQGVSSMRPVRVTTPGATPTLPLRMVAVGSGPIVPITLWVVAEGRYDTTNLPSFQVDPSQLVWDWDTQESNYSALKQSLFTKSNNRGWLVEAAEPFSMYTLQSQLSYLVQSDPVASGYADDMGLNADTNLADDMATLFAGIPDASMWVTRFEGELSHAALAADLQIAASANQSQVQRFFQLTQSIGTAPACPVQQPCGGGGVQTPGFGFLGSGGSPNEGGGTCAMSRLDGNGALFAGLSLAAALTLVSPAVGGLTPERSRKPSVTRLRPHGLPEARPASSLHPRRGPHRRPRDSGGSMYGRHATATTAAPPPASPRSARSRSPRSEPARAARRCR